jgi:hypothetical protein
MKRYSLLLLVLVAVVFAVSCRDTTSPAGSHALLSPKNPNPVVLGNKPPPPVDAAIAVTITSTPVTAIFTGVFFNNGKISDDGLDAVETFDGMAWLRFDNKQPDAVGFFASAATSANARFMVKGLETPTGSGTLTIGGVDYKIDQVISFARFASCGATGDDDVAPSPCAHIEFTVTDPLGLPHGGHLLAFEKAECLVTDPKTGLEYNCPDLEEGVS